MVFGIAYNFLHDAAAAEDLAQDVFLELHRSLGRVESREQAVRWLRKVTAHRCIDYARRAQYRSGPALEDVPEQSIPPIFPDPFLSGQIAKQVALLAETPRIVLILRYQEDMEPAEIAETLHMPVNTVKSHLQRALATLRPRLERLRGVVKL